MSVRVALSSANGKTVHQHFGRTTQFIICDIDGNSVHYRERRDNAPPCGTGDPDGDSGHDEDRMEQTIDVIADCRAVISAQIGRGAAARLAGRGIQAFAIPDFIDRAIERLVASGLLADAPIPVRRWVGDER